MVLAEDDTTIERIDTLHSDDRDCDPEHAAMVDEAKARFRQAFERLPERERKVAVLLYVYNLTLREIGEILGVTESRVCQIHGQITKKLRVELEADEAAVQRSGVGGRPTRVYEPSRPLTSGSSALAAASAAA